MSAVEWDSEALNEFDNTPFAARRFSRELIERYTAVQGKTKVTIAEVQEIFSKLGMPKVLSDA